MLKIILILIRIRIQVKNILNDMLIFFNEKKDFLFFLILFLLCILSNIFLFFNIVILYSIQYFGKENKT